MEKESKLSKFKLYYEKEDVNLKKLSSIKATYFGMLAISLKRKLKTKYETYQIKKAKERKKLQKQQELFERLAVESEILDAAFGNIRKF